MKLLNFSNDHPTRIVSRPSRETGMATLMATVILLIVATLSALMVARSAFFEQKVTGSDIRNKEVYASAISGLDYGIQSLMSGKEIWDTLDPDDGSGVIGAMAYPAAPLDTVQRADVYSFDPDGDGTPSISYELMTDGGDNIAVIKVSATATAEADSQVTKTVEVLAIQAALLNPSIVDGPPLVVDKCIPKGADVIGGTPKIFPALLKEPNNPLEHGANFYARHEGENYPDPDPDPDADPPPPPPVMHPGLDTPRNDSLGNLIPWVEPSIASVNRNEADHNCLYEGHFETYYVDSLLDAYTPLDQNNDGNIPIWDEDGKPIVEKAYGNPEDEAGNPTEVDFYKTFFSPITRLMLQQMSHTNPEAIIYVDDEYAAGGAEHFYSFNGNSWHATPLGSDSQDPVTGLYDDQVILFFSKEYGCPTINGGAGAPVIEIYGLVFIDTPDCDLSGWGQVKIYGTLAVNGDLNKFNANVELHDRDLDTFAGSDSPYTVTSLIPGTWRDFN